MTGYSQSARWIRNRPWPGLFLAAAFGALLSACSRQPADGSEGPMEIRLTSPAFEEGAPIPRRYTCDGENVSPPLAWSGLPPNTRSVALICDDPDAPGGTWVHWVLHGLDPAGSSLEEGMPPEGDPSRNIRQGKNDFGKTGYGGPCPPPGKPHHYVFRLYALDAVLDLGLGASKKDLLRAMEGHILARGRLVGTYER